MNEEVDEDIYIKEDIKNEDIKDINEDINEDIDVNDVNLNIKKISLVSKLAGLNSSSSSSVKFETG